MKDELIANLVAKIEQLETLLREHVLSQKVALSFDEAVKYMGISNSLLYKLTCKREIPSYKPGGKILFFKRTDLDNWMLSKRRMTGKELKTEAQGRLK